jgi:hypothetical protein
MTLMGNQLLLTTNLAMFWTAGQAGVSLQQAADKIKPLIRKLWLQARYGQGPSATTPVGAWECG